MERIQNTDKPFSSLTGIRKYISYDDNDTNVKYQSKTKLEGLNNLLLNRQDNINQIRVIEKDIYHNIILKLKRVLSRRFNLSEQDYLIMIDRYNLKSTEISRKKILEMIDYLNFQKKYQDKSNEKKKSDEFIIKRQDDIKTLNNNNPYNSIITADCEPELDFLDKKTNKQNLEDRLQQMQIERDALNPKMNNSNNTQIHKLKNINLNDTFNSKETVVNLGNISNNISETQFLKSGDQIPKYDIEDTLPQLNNRIDSSNRTNSNNIEISIDNIDSSANNSNSSSNMISINSNIENSLQQIADDIKKSNIYKKDGQEKLKKIKTLNLMANIITSRTVINSTSNKLEFNINYANKEQIDNVTKVELISCFVNRNFYEKNDFKSSPYFLVKICEFDDILYLNGTNIGGFCQIMWEHKNNYYNYINNDKLFGIYSPSESISLNKLTIELYNHKGELLDNIKSTEKDQFNIIFKITQSF